ncbi:DUF1835 domain-containing protein [Pseudalkalibacillus sp. NRS-1564]|uniref:DUF1835 domain-containing protein n=1 Tax=Pseudalkalibacillus sp. NRS-1564 TaxID=3233900 RepID=UPI003D26FF1E
MIDEFKKIVESSTEQEVKSLLFQILLRINMVEEVEQYSDTQLVKDLKMACNSFLEYKTSQINREDVTQYQAVHIVFGASLSGSLNIVFKKMKLKDTEKIISFSDLLSIGPVWRLHEKNGLRKRYEWLKNYINFDDEDIDNYQENFNDATLKISAIPENTPIIFWVGHNAHEQTALRYVLYLLKGKNNDVSLIDATTKFKDLFDTTDTKYTLLHTGEISPEKLELIYKNNRKNSPLSQDERKQFEEEWEALSTKQEVLRIWKNSEICSVDEAYYDDYIINVAKRLHNEQEHDEFMKSARVIGEVIGHLDQYIGDQYIEYRLRNLILDGAFDIKGIPKAMRYYSVRPR